MPMPSGSNFITALHNITPAGLIAGGAIAGAVAIAFGVEKAYKCYKHKKWQEHLKEMQDVNEIAQATIGKIFIIPGGEYKSLPLPFKFDDIENPINSKKIDSFHLASAEIEAAGDLPEQDGLVDLDDYLEKIRSAQLILKDYLQFRMKEISAHENTDVTCSVLSHMIYLNQTYAMNFKGFRWDIEYLEAIANYINRYASLSKHDIKSQHFNRLADVYKLLNEASDILLKSKENTSLAFSMAEMKNTCKESSRMLLTTLSKLILDDRKHQAVNNAPIELIAAGIIRKKHVNIVASIPLIGPKAFTHTGEIMLPESIFKEWIENLAGYYIKSIDASSPWVLTDIPTINDLIEADTKKIETALKKPTPEFKKILEIFKNVTTFFTTQAVLKNPNDASPENRHISNESEIIKRVLFYKQVALLCHELISMTYLSTSILNSTKQLGEIYMKNPKHFHHMFDKFYQIATQIKSKIENIIKFMREMDNNLMIHSANKNFFNDVEKNLKALSAILDEEKHQINGIRERRKKSDTEQKAELIHRLSDIIEEMTKTFNLQLNPKKDSDFSNQGLEDSSTSDDSTHSSTSSPGTPDHISNLHDIPTPDFIINEPQIDFLLNSILTGIGAIQTNEHGEFSGQQQINFEKEINLYKKLYHSLQDIYQDSLSLKLQAIREKNDSEKTKATKIEERLRDICIKTIGFLKKTREARNQEADNFYNSIKEDLSNTKELCALTTPLWKRVLEAIWDIVLCLTVIGAPLLLWKHGLLLKANPQNKVIEAEKTARELKDILSPIPMATP